MSKKLSLPKTLSWSYGAVLATAAVVYLGGVILEHLNQQPDKQKKDKK
jgi:hypothetical protein